MQAGVGPGVEETQASGEACREGEGVVKKPLDIDQSSEAARLQFAVAIELQQAIKAAGLTQREVARRLDRADSFVSKVLNGDSNVTLATLARFSVAIGFHWRFGRHKPLKSVRS